MMDFVTPIYRRHRFEGMLVTNLMYPMTRALYGKPVREPHPGEFAFSDRLAGRLVSHPCGPTTPAAWGPKYVSPSKPSPTASDLPDFPRPEGPSPGAAASRPGHRPATDRRAAFLVDG